MSRCRVTTGALLVALTTGCGPQTPPPTDGSSTTSSSSSSTSDRIESAWFEDVTATAGLDFVHVKAEPTGRYWFPEMTGSGCGLFDADGDGDLDAYLVQAGELSEVLAGREQRHANRLYANDGKASFTDVTEAAGVGDRGYGMGCAVGDPDRDGDLELHVTNVGSNVLYRNEGDGRFTDVSKQAGIGGDQWSLTSAFFDHDADGDQDLFVANYLIWSPETDIACTNPQGQRDYCGPRSYKTVAPDQLLRNDGGLRFTEVSREAGLGAVFGSGMGVACADFDRNGRLDVYVTNDGRANQLWMNRDGRFQDEAVLRGCALSSTGMPEASMGVVAGDLDRDGSLDLFLTHLRSETNTAYLNNGKGFFRDRTTRTGLAKSSLAFTGFGVALVDFDADGHEDLYITNGRVEDKLPRYSETDVYAEPDLLYRGLGDGKFVEQLPRGGTESEWIGAGRGVATGDVDGDGDVDLLTTDSHGPARLLLNTVAGGHWLLLDVRDRYDVAAFGAVVELSAGGTTWHRLVQASLSYCSTNDPRVHFGLGTQSSVDALVVTWPDGTRERFPTPTVDAVHSIIRGEGESE
ncbi:MAG: CRTAC1 family protein [Acidobacteriota bacterium]